MSSGKADTRRDAVFVNIDDPGPRAGDTGRMFRCEVHLYPQPAGGFVAVAAALPGVAGTGATELEALADVTRAFEAAIPGYLANGGSVPWTAGATLLEGGLVRFVFAKV